ncbi:MAG: Uncharacterised protein [Prochlorococcus marinus str. MIT 9215]|nr:MAG: Uncharacterised protein [Prochlorococcus marinus str. MIT 9215]
MSRRLFNRQQFLLLALLLTPTTLDTSLGRPSFAGGNHNHGGGGEEVLEAGEFSATPVLSIEGHGGFMTNLDGNPEHYAIDGLVGLEMEWGLENGGSIAIEAAIGPSLVWGEAEHFYGKVHADDHAEHDDEEHDEHEDDDHEDHDDHGEKDHDMHSDDDHDDHSDDDDDDHAGHETHSSHGSHNSDYKRTDVRGFLQVRYAPNDRLSLSVSWNPYYVTQDQGEDIKGLKNELGATAVWALGDGDVNFALGDRIEDLIDGVYLSLDHRQGWESDGTWMGNYTDPRIGVGFNIDKLNLTLNAGPRFYVPGSYSGLEQRTDFAGELGLTYPVASNTVVFAHWEPAYSSKGGSGWGKGWQHHVGTGVTFSF